MNAPAHAATSARVFKVDALEPGQRRRDDAVSAGIGENLRLSTAGLEAYFFSDWQPALVDLMVVAAAVEFCDIAEKRRARGWARRFDVRVAVHDPALWNSPTIKAALEDALCFLTGDAWTFGFEERKAPLERVKERTLGFDSPAKLIMPYSNGLDSRAVAALTAHSEGNGLVRVRLGSVGADQQDKKRRRQPFAAVPYKVKVRPRRESSARSRGFKFAVVTGVAAILAKVGRVIVTESGQGALGPVLTVTGHAYPDYRVHPAFTARVEHLIEVLTGHRIHYVFPRLWSTKGETLAAAASLPNPPDWSDARSCWQQSRQVAVDGRQRQCGVCAACMLRRMSMFKAGLPEPTDTYVWENLSAPTIRGGAAKGFSLFTTAMDEYAVAGVLHLDHLAAIAGSGLHAGTLRRAAREVAYATGEDLGDVEEKLISLLERHREEWRAFLSSLGSNSFVLKLASVSP